MEITYLVATYNRKDKILNLINNFILQKKKFNLIILDTNSSDYTYDEILKINDPRITVIRHEKNKGLMSFLYLAKKVKTEIFTWLSDEDIVNLNNEKYIINLFSTKKIDVLLGSVIYGEDWLNVSFSRSEGIKSRLKKIVTLLNFSGLAGPYIRTSSFNKSQVLNNLDMASSYNFWNYYPIGIMALESCIEKLYVSKSFFAVQACFAETTDHFVADDQKSQLSEAHYFPKSIVDRFYSQTSWINNQKLNSFNKNVAKAEMLYILFLRLKYSKKKECINMISDCYGKEVLEKYQIAINKFFRKSIFWIILDIIKLNFNFIGKSICSIIILKNLIKNFLFNK